MSSKILVVVGGGAAGYFCAVNAARLNPSLQVILLEKSAKVLSKVKISGGGRCNLTHACFDIDTMVTRYPRGARFLKKAFYQFFTTDTIRWFEERGVQLKTEQDGRMFPVSDDSQTIIDCLLREAATFGVTTQLQSGVSGLESRNGRFRVQLAEGNFMDADFVCVASGGYPKEAQFGWLKATGHTLAAPVPSLFTFNMPGHPITTLMGVSAAHVQLKITGTTMEQEGPLLITHWGFSGPAVLKLSAVAARELHARDYHFTVRVNWLPAYNEQSLREKIKEARSSLARQKIGGKNIFGLPARLWQFLAQASGVTEAMRWADLPASVLNGLVKQLCAFEAVIHGKTTFKEEFVTAGGISLGEVDPQTMMSKRIPGLYFAGEVLDVDGITGGYNFQHAWTSGYIAAKSIAASAI